MWPWHVTPPKHSEHREREQGSWATWERHDAELLARLKDPKRNGYNRYPPPLSSSVEISFYYNRTRTTTELLPSSYRVVHTTTSPPGWKPDNLITYLYLWFCYIISVLLNKTIKFNINLESSRYSIYNILI